MQYLSVNKILLKLALLLITSLNTMGAGTVFKSKSEWQVAATTSIRITGSQIESLNLGGNKTLFVGTGDVDAGWFPSPMYLWQMSALGVTTLGIDSATMSPEAGNSLFIGPYPSSGTFLAVGFTISSGSRDWLVNGETIETGFVGWIAGSSALSDFRIYNSTSAPASDVVVISEIQYVAIPEPMLFQMTAISIFVIFRRNRTHF